MADLLSNHLKAVFFPDDITTDIGHVVHQQDCLTVRTYMSAISRTREGHSVAGGLSTGSEFRFSVRIHSSSDGRFFYESLWREGPQSFSILFNARFGPEGLLRGYDDAMVVTGYVVDVSTAFDSARAVSGNGLQMEMEVSVLLYSIVYPGTDSDRTLVVRQTSTF